MTAPRLAAVALGILAALATAATARADGEAGLVVQHGDGTVETFCIAFTGNGINGDELLRRAGVAFEQVNGLVCAVGPDPSEGCRGATSLESCTCRCRPGSSDCVYWSYFTRRHGQSWVYSAVGFTGQVSRDGDLQAWRWGKGGPTSAPAPADVTFEQACGHAPGLASTTATAGSRPTATNAPVATVGETVPTGTAATASSPVVTLTRPPDAAVTPGPATPAVLLTTTLPGIATGDADVPEEGREGTSSLLAFAAVAGGLVAATAAGLAWRRRRGR